MTPKSVPLMEKMKTLKKRIALASDTALRCPAVLCSPDQSRPQIIATEVVRLPPMLNVRNLLTFSIWRAPACAVSC